jgi:hypothetical protein
MRDTHDVDAAGGAPENQCRGRRAGEGDPAMEMHQIRTVLAICATLNFTRVAAHATSST